MTSTPTPGSPSGSSPGSPSSTPQGAAPEQPTFDAVCAASPLVQATLADTVRTLRAAGTFGASTENVESRTLLAPLVASVTATSGRTIVALKVLILGSTADTSTGRSEPLVSVTYRDTTASTYAFTLAPAADAAAQTRTATGAPTVDAGVNAAVSPARSRRRREPATKTASADAPPPKPRSRRASTPSVTGRFDLTSRPRLLCFAPALALLGWLIFTCVAIRLDLSWREDRLAPDEDLALAGIAYLYPIVVSLLAFPAAAIPAGYAWLRRPDDVLRRVGSWGSALICGPVLAFALLHLLSLNGILARLAALPALLILAVPVTAAARVAIAETADARQQVDGTEQP